MYIYRKKQQAGGNWMDRRISRMLRVCQCLSLTFPAASPIRGNSFARKPPKANASLSTAITCQRYHAELPPRTSKILYLEFTSCGATTLPSYVYKFHIYELDYFGSGRCTFFIGLGTRWLNLLNRII